MLKRSCKNTLKKKDEPAGRPETNDLVLLLSSELLVRLSPHLLVANIFPTLKQK